MTPNAPEPKKSVGRPETYFMVGFQFGDKLLQLPIRHPDTYVEDLERIKSIAEQNNNAPVANALGQLLADADYVKSIATHIHRAYYDFRLREDGFRPDELLKEENGRNVPTALTTELRKQGMLCRAFNPDLWVGREEDALRVFNALDALYPQDWLQPVREQYLEHLQHPRTPHGFGPRAQAIINRRQSASERQHE